MEFTLLGGLLFMKALSALAQSVRASTTMAIDTQFKKMRAEGIDVIGFSVGEPDFPTPEHIKQAGIRAIENDQTKYTPTPSPPAAACAPPGAGPGCRGWGCIWSGRSQWP